eukprot:1183690-Prorocentrum_minimum.AAC.2
MLYRVNDPYYHAPKIFPCSPSPDPSKPLLTPSSPPSRTPSSYPLLFPSSPPPHLLLTPSSPPPPRPLPTPFPLTPSPELALPGRCGAWPRAPPRRGRGARA